MYLIEIPPFCSKNLFCGFRPNYKQLRRSLQHPFDIYQKASDAEIGYKVIIYFTEDELVKTKRILRELELDQDPNIYLVDARNDNKPSGSKA